MGCLPVYVPLSLVRRRASGQWVENFHPVGHQQEVFILEAPPQYSEPTVYDDVPDYEFTGVLDAQGEPLYRAARGTLGFLEWGE